MKALGMTGLILGIACLAFGLYLHFVVVPDSDIAAATVEHMQMENMDLDKPMAEQPGYLEALEAMDKKVELGGYLFFASMLPVLLCLIASFKKDKKGMLGLVVSLAAFFIGAAYGTHMFS
ncbi:MAG: hypothetical protein ACOZCO_12950 [Bacteroidota bacterium]